MMRAMLETLARFAITVAVLFELIYSNFLWTITQESLNSYCRLHVL